MPTPCKSVPPTASHNGGWSARLKKPDEPGQNPQRQRPLGSKPSQQPGQNGQHGDLRHLSQGHCRRDPRSRQAPPFQIAGNDLVDHRGGQVNAKRCDEQNRDIGLAGQLEAVPQRMFAPRPDRQGRRMGQGQTIDRDGQRRRSPHPDRFKRTLALRVDPEKSHDQRDDPASDHPARRAPQLSPSQTRAADRSGCASPASCSDCTQGRSSNQKPGRPRTSSPPGSTSADATTTSNAVPIAYVNARNHWVAMKRSTSWPAPRGAASEPIASVAKIQPRPRPPIPRSAR